MEDVGAPEATVGSSGTRGAHEQKQEAGQRSDYKAQQRRVKLKRELEEQIKSETRAEKLPAKTGEEEFANLVKLVSKTIIPVEEPVAMISQAPRSGGTLLRHLFDGHPQCHVHPYEWHFGDRKTRWPRFREGLTPEALWVRLREEVLAHRFASGIKPDQVKVRVPARDRLQGRTIPMTLPPRLQRALFLKRVGQIPEQDRTMRAILDAYLTSLFNAWLNNHTLDDADKRWVVAFAPRLTWREGLEGFFSAYPDGALISVLRDPYSWFNSSRGRQLDVQHDERLMKLWVEGAQEMLRSKELYPERVTIISFDDLLRDTPGVMTLLSERLGIAYDDRLTQPTFNSRQISSNSSYGGTAEVSLAPLERWKTMLSEDDQRSIEAMCGELHRQVGEYVDRPEAHGTLFVRQRPRRSAT